MNGPPGREATSNGITGTRPNAETKRRAHRGSSPKKVVAAKVIRAMRSAGMQPQGWQVRSLTTTLLANREQPSDQQVIEALMRAPWFRKPGRRHWRVGEGGGWAVRS